MSCSPARPAEEQEHLKVLRDNLYRAVLDYSFNYTESDKKDKDGLESFGIAEVGAGKGR